MKTIIRFLGFIAIIGIGYVIYDNYQAKKEQKERGIGFEIHADSGFYCSSNGIDVSKLKENQTFYLDVLNFDTAGSLKEASSLPDSRIKVKVLAVEKSSTIKDQKIAILDFTHLVVGSKEFNFNGYISPDASRPGDTLRNDGKFLGSFAGMEAGAIGIVGGFILGEKAIATIRRHTECPLSFIISPGVDEKTMIHVRAYKPLFIPLGIKPKIRKEQGWFDKLIDFFS